MALTTRERALLSRARRRGYLLVGPQMTPALIEKWRAWCRDHGREPLVAYRRVGTIEQWIADRLGRLRP
jgi:hypothetical protein